MNRVPIRRAFDDHCRLADADFRDVRLVEFFGVSGSGKSTALAFLCERHREFCCRTPTVIDPNRPLPAANLGGLAIVEELRRPSDLAIVVALLRRGATVLVASHLRPAWSAPLGIFWRRRSFVLDRDWTKIARHLSRRGVPASETAVRAYCRRYGANYVDVEIILERAPEATFDEAFAKFQRLCRIDRRPVVEVRP
mgnify:CR=1 FL=1